MKIKKLTTREKRAISKYFGEVQENGGHPPFIGEAIQGNPMKDVFNTLTKEQFERALEYNGHGCFIDFYEVLKEKKLIDNGEKEDVLFLLWNMNSKVPFSKTEWSGSTVWEVMAKMSRDLSHWEFEGQRREIIEEIGRIFLLILVKNRHFDIMSDKNYNQ